MQQILRHLPLVRVNGFDRQLHQHDTSGFLFMPFEYQPKVQDVAGHHVDWQAYRSSFGHPRDAFVRIGDWPDVQYYVKLDTFEDHATYVEACNYADADPLTHLEWADLLRRVKAAH